LERPTVLRPGNNGFVGRSSPDIGKLKNLTVLDMAGTVPQGDLPLSMGGLDELHTLLLSGNRLSGKMPVASYFFPRWSTVFTCTPREAAMFFLRIPFIIMRHHHAYVTWRSGSRSALASFLRSCFSMP